MRMRERVTKWSKRPALQACKGGNREVEVEVEVEVSGFETFVTLKHERVSSIAHVYDMCPL